MDTKKSLEIILGQIDEAKEAINTVVHNILAAMEEIDKDIGFFLDNKEIEKAKIYQLAFNELQIITNALMPLSYREIEYAKDILQSTTQEGEHGEEHKAATET